MCNCIVLKSSKLMVNSSKLLSYSVRLLYFYKPPRYITVPFSVEKFKLGFANNLVFSQFYINLRNYAKGKDRPKSSKGNIFIMPDEELAEFTNIKKLRAELDTVVASLKDEYIKQISLRSSAGAIESLPITFEGQEYTLQDLAQISKKSSKLVVLNMALFPQTIPTVIDAIHKSGMNLNPQQDSTSIYIEIPKVTKEHREGLAKSANLLFVKCKTKINDIMSFHVKKMESKLNQGMSVEQFRLAQKQITEIAKSYVGEAEKLKNSKQAEVLRES